jgi:hypothetical protein
MGEVPGAVLPVEAGRPRFLRILPQKSVQERRFLSPAPQSPEEQVATFLRDGLLVLEIPESEVKASVHQAIKRRANQLSFGSYGNNILPEIPELDQVITSETVSKALRTQLGPEYRLHRHRWLHVSSAQGDQNWHKDSYFGGRWMRSHRTRWLMAFYYPQDTVLEMGATAVLPGSQYVTVNHCDESETWRAGEDVLTQGFLSGATSESQLFLANWNRECAAKALDPSLQERFVTVKAGSVVLMHYDLIHRGSCDIRHHFEQAQNQRCMVKFQFYRVLEPQPESVSTVRIDGSEQMRPVHEAMLRWLSPVVPLTHARARAHVYAEQLASLKADLIGNSEPARIAAAYSLGELARFTDSPAVRQEALHSLASAMLLPREETRRASSFGFATAGPEGVELLLEMLGPNAPNAARKYVLWSLGEAGVASERVLRALLDSLEARNMHGSKDWGYVSTLQRATAVAAIGLLGARVALDEVFAGVCDALIKAAGDETEPPTDNTGSHRKFLVRQAAALALLKICAAAPARAAAQNGVLNALTKLLTNEDRYAFGFAMEALRSLADGGSAKALQVLHQVFARELADAPGADLARLVRCQRCTRTDPTF